MACSAVHFCDAQRRPRRRWTVGIVEDPATGTAAGRLPVALVRAGRVPEGGTAHVEQGHALGRPSRLQVEVLGELLRLSGSGLVVGHGRLTI